MIDRPFVDFTPTEARPLRSGPTNGIRHDLLPGTIIFGPDEVVRETALAFAMTPELLTSADRTRQVSEARDAAFYLLRQHTRLCLEQMSRALGRNDHSTSLRGYQRAAKRREADAWFREVTDRLERELEAKAKGAAA
jgi:chromosomal replication initiation ATPase DnaA